MFEIKNVTRKFGNELVLDNISMTIKGGMNFIIGASGSGKTTLLRSISGMDSEFEGYVAYNGMDIKKLSEGEKINLYGNTFGFISQNFNLIEGLTVLENVMLPLQLSGENDEKAAMQILKSLGIKTLAKQKVKKLSGGQKQRVAIARELLKNPEVIIADEPTAALDSKSAKVIIDVLKKISKKRTVIVVTHDTSLIDNSSSVFELDKGILINTSEKNIIDECNMTKKEPLHLSLFNAFNIGFTNIKRYKGRCLSLLLAIIVSVSCLLVNFSGAIGDSSKEMFDDLFESYGDTILDMMITSNFISASGMDENSNNKGPSAEVSQNISGLYNKYLDDHRVEYVVLSQNIFDNKVIFNGKQYKPEQSGQAPMINKIVSGRTPSGDNNEVVISKKFVEKLGETNESILGKEIEIKTTVFNHEGKNPQPIQAKVKAKVVGVADTTQAYEYEGKIYKNEPEDTFIFSYSAVEELRKQANQTMNDVSFTIRAKDPYKLIELKDELMREGITPIGQFMLVEGIVRLDSMSKEQSGSAYVIIGVLAIAAVLIISFITTFLRKREFAIYKINGYNKASIYKILFSEYTIVSLLSAGIMITIGMIYNGILKSALGTKFLNGRLVVIGSIMIVAVIIGMFIMSIFVSNTVNESKDLKSGDR